MQADQHLAVIEDAIGADVGLGAEWLAAALTDHRPQVGHPFPQAIWVDQLGEFASRKTNSSWTRSPSPAGRPADSLVVPE